MRAALLVLCFGLIAFGAWFAMTKIAQRNQGVAFVSPLIPSAVVKPAANALPAPSGPEFTMYHVPITKVTETTITVRGNKGEMTLAKDRLWVSKMHNNIVSNATRDALQAGQRVDIQSIKGKTTVLILL